ncbi:hypothetical protein ACFVYJ_00370 [Pontibacter sp. JAM-7]|uniref:hypothetical protein n=1 Tax=Pontibacter sp. JAM-7 TaxID=3366581 RepID=UPI003AF5F2B0
MLRILLLFIALIGAVLWFNKEPPASMGHSGVLVPSTPLQAPPDDTNLVTMDDYLLLPLAEFSMQGRVLGRENYRFGREAELSPMDLALGWGEMSDSAVLARIDISQSNRFYYWRTERFPIPRKQIETQSANMHLIPATDYIAGKMDEVRPGDLVQFSGQLVEARAEDGWRWRSSLTRQDTGNGACELVLVRDLFILPPP